MKRHPGVVIGIVKSLEDPDGEGKIQVEFPWLEEGKRSGWAPVAVAMAGKNRGMYFMPEIDDEVLVAFEHGDFNHPFIIGFLWNGVDHPPEMTNKNRIIKTPGGHQLRFEDREGEKKVILRSNGGHIVEIDDSAHTIAVKTKAGGQSVVLNDTSQSITIQGGGRIVQMSGGMIQMS